MLACDCLLQLNIFYLLMIFLPPLLLIFPAVVQVHGVELNPGGGSWSVSWRLR